MLLRGPAPIAPTVLAWLGVPRGADMPGRVLEEIFESAPREATVSSWDTQPPAVPPPEPPAAEPLGIDAGALDMRFIERGHRVHPGLLIGAQGAALIAEENQANLGAALRALGRPEEALLWLHMAALAAPESTTRAVELAHCLLDTRLYPKGERAAQPFLDYGTADPRARLLRAQLLIPRKGFTEALELLESL